MKMIEVIAQVDEKHRLSATVPSDVAPGPVKIAFALPEQDETDQAWTLGVSKEWNAELSDSREDIYTLEDGEPVDEAR